MVLKSILNEIEENYSTMVSFRRALHEQPELSFQEENTSKLVAMTLKEYGLEVREQVGGNGVVGYLKGGKKGKTIAFRADFDALPIQDEKDVNYKSQVPGAMHACGHDGHTAILLCVAKILSKYRKHINGTIVFIHQFGEELIPGGAKAMIADGCLKGVDEIYGLHLDSMADSGNIYVRDGFMMASQDKFEIKVKGRGGHGALPHEAIDPIIISSQIALNLQSINSRTINPVEPSVISICTFNSGFEFNIIPESAKLAGTVRTFNTDIRKHIEESIERITKNTCEANNASVDMKYENGYDAVWNHSLQTEKVKIAAQSIIGIKKVKIKPLAMTSDDFAYYLQEVPGSYFFLGAKLTDPEKVYPHHHPKFDFNENVMTIGAKVFIRLAFSELKH